MKDFYNIFLKYYWILFFLFFLWLVHFANIYFHLNLYKLGVFPRTLDGLWGIVFAPLVHSSSDNNHLINNSVPFLILTWAMFYFCSTYCLESFIFFMDYNRDGVWFLVEVLFILVLVELFIANYFFYF